MSFLKGFIDPNGDMGAAVGIIIFVIETLALILIGIIGAVVCAIETIAKDFKKINKSH